jgi:hypothetical protein
VENCEQEHSTFDIGLFENELEDEDDDEYDAHRTRRRGTHHSLLRGR